jgi:hypothetical protein
MIVGRGFYRLRQFWSVLYAAPSAGELDKVRSLLTPPQMALFLRMHRSEQAHSIQVMGAVFHASHGVQAEARQDLLKAALLHDVGKSRYPVRIWERVLIVLSKAFLPGQVKRWGNGDAEGSGLGWRRAFVVAEQHPAWGAKVAAEAGASPLVTALIRRHQDPRSNSSESLEDRLLHILQAADHEL